METIFERLEKVGVIPVVKMDIVEHAIPLAKFLRNGGISAIEVTFRSDAAAESIRQIVKEVPEMLVIAGTVLTPEMAEMAMEAGASGIVSPGLNLETVEWCTKRNVPMIPGVATPGEVELCMRHGLNVLKLFPAEVLGGVKFLKALAGPYPFVRFMPTGGINLGNIEEYLAQKNVICCGGTWIVPDEVLESGDFEEIKRRAKEARVIFLEVRKNEVD